MDLSAESVTDHGLIVPLKLKKTQGEGIVPQHGAISFEMQDWPDGLNHPEWRREGKTIWGMDGLYTAFSSYRFSVNKEEP